MHAMMTLDVELIYKSSHRSHVCINNNNDKIKWYPSLPVSSEKKAHICARAARCSLTQLGAARGRVVARAEPWKHDDAAAVDDDDGDGSSGDDDGELSVGC